MDWETFINSRRPANLCHLRIDARSLNEEKVTRIAMSLAVPAPGRPLQTLDFVGLSSICDSTRELLCVAGAHARCVILTSQ